MSYIVPDVKIDFKELISGFAVPIDIKNDIVYCQKTLRSYLKVHQNVVSRMGSKVKIPHVRKNLDEVEKGIFEINSEQKLLMLRLRKALEEYYNSLKNESHEIDREAGNMYLAGLFATYINDPNYLCEPINVRKRPTENQLLSSMGLDDLKKMSEAAESITTPPPLTTLYMNPKQISLLKPKAERFAQQQSTINSINGENESSLYPPKRQEQEREDKCEPAATTMSTAINNSRMKLLQALNKAKNETMNAFRIQSSFTNSNSITKRRYETRSPQSSTSDDSPDTRESSPSINDELADPERSQETFLRLFGLYTLEYSQYLMRRRSKRKRRNVQSNEKSDYHYGALRAFEKQEKKRRVYLYSPPTTRALKRKKAENDKDVQSSSKSSTVDRSSSSSPSEQKLVCRECLKNDDNVLNRCEICSGVFHLKCFGPILVKAVKLKEIICPTCYRTRKTRDPKCKKIAKQRAKLIKENQLLWTQYKKLADKIENNYGHKMNLLKASEVFKTNMRNLFNIIDTFKNE